ncbi:MAG TPA: Si-specific NAD(P)(+) transhydrogenase [Mycobacteriales bacterium]|nr:Si-specific NAD(P)(+) transhydrogenase [Mycobacteriales bacterium]
MEHYDLVVIGTGPAGEKAAVQAAYFGRRVAVVEQNELTGGVAVTHVGMIPTKTLREAALYVTGFRKRDIYGVSVELDPAKTYAALRSRTNDVIDTMARQVRHNIVDRHHVDLVHGQARLAGGGVVLVTTPHGERRLQGAAVLIATGSRPYHPPGVPFDDPDVLDAEGVLGIEDPPRSVVVVGGGAIGCEHASIFTALGAHVTVVDRGERLLTYVDAELSELLGRAFAEMGMELRLRTGIAGISRDAEGLRVGLTDGSELRPDKVLVASGRSGNTEELDLAAAGVAVDERGRIVVDASFRTTAPGVYAAGDVIGPPALASTAMEQGRVAAAAAIGVPSQTMVDPSPPTGVYSIPEIASVGLTEQAAAALGEDYVAGRASFESNSRANISGATEGLVKLVVDRSSRRLLGVHILGEAATEAIHLGQAVLKHGDTIDYFITTTFNVPTLCEAYKYAAYDALQRLNEPALA